MVTEYSLLRRQKSTTMKLLTAFFSIVGICGFFLVMSVMQAVPMPGARLAPAQVPDLSARLFGSSAPVKQWRYSSAKPAAPSSPDEYDYLAGIRVAGLNRDSSRLADMVACLKSTDPASVATGLHALAHLGDERAIPDVEQVVQNYPAGYIRAEAKSARARLLAESTGRSLTIPGDRAGVKTTKFMSEEGIDATILNAGVLAYYSSSGEGQGLPHEVDSLRELADMAYREPDADYLALPLLQKINFSQDPGSTLKIKLAVMPKAARVPWMINELAHKTILHKEDALLTQLAVDEGTSSSQQVAIKLTEMDAQRDQYTYTGFSALFDVLRGIGDSRQAPTVEHFLNDKDTWVAYYAQQVYPDVKRGLRRQYAIGY